jgi:polar amino acid transport system substrate-binding protein
LRSTDTLARLGGDEFVIIVPDLEKIDSIPQFLKRILKNISKPYIIDEHEVNITCSMGFSVYPDNGEDTETLLKNADNAMYQAKEEGKNTFKFYVGEMQTHVKKRFEIENDLRKALIKKEFFLEYQPKLEIKSKKLVGFEALVRWKHPKYGIIPPNDFISFAEDMGLIIPLGKWVLETACKQNKKWQDAGLPPLCVSVNLSSRQCREKNLFQTIKKVLEDTGLAPQYLELELTESLAMSNPKEFITLLLQFKELGVKTSIDDFGTGYSSLNYLRQFPVNCLKIDQSFIKEMETRAGDLSIVKAIVSLGHSLNMTVIAEGVETKQQLLELQEQNCDEIQGYYLSRPISAQAMTKFQKTYKDSL